MADVLKLSMDERMELVQDICTSIEVLPGPVTLTEAQQEELDRRLDDYHRHPERGIPWEDLKAELISGD